MLFEGSPLRPTGSRDHAESSYKFDSQALYTESIDVYDNALNIHDVVWNGFSAVSNCRGDATGVSPSGDFRADEAEFLRHDVRRCPGVDHDPSELDLSVWVRCDLAGGSGHVGVRFQRRISDGGLGVEKKGTIGRPILVTPATSVPDEPAMLRF
jgi:hypothetical protein